MFSTTTRPSKRPRPAAPLPSLLPTALERMLAWLASSGARGLDGVRVAPSRTPGGGLCVYAARAIPPGGAIASIPPGAVATPARAHRSAVGRACAALGPAPAARPSAEFVFLLWLAAGRRDAAHPLHPYLAALPGHQPDAPAWPLPLRQMLQGTNLGVAVQVARDRLTEEYDRFVPALAAAHPALFREEGEGGEEGSGAKGRVHGDERGDAKGSVEGDVEGCVKGSVHGDGNDDRDGSTGNPGDVAGKRARSNDLFLLPSPWYSLEQMFWARSMYVEESYVSIILYPLYTL